MRRKIIGAIVAAFALVGLAACGTTQATPAPSTTEPETMSMNEAADYYTQVAADFNEKVNAYAAATNSSDVLEISEAAGEAAEASQAAADAMRAKQWPEEVQKYADATADEFDALAPLYEKTADIATINEINSIWEGFVSNGASQTLRKALGLKSAEEEAAAKIGETQTNGNLEMTVNSVATQPTINYDTCGDGCSAGTYAPKSAPEGQQYFVASVTVKNNGKESIDLTCSAPLVISAVNENDERFDSIPSLYQIQGNPECSSNLQPGQSADISYPFEIGLDDTIKSLVWENITYLTQDGVQPSTEMYYSVE